MTLLTVLALAIASASAYARGAGDRGYGRHFNRPHIGGHHFSRPRLSFGIILGAPALWYYSPPPYYPPLVVVPSAPPVYIERGSAPSVPDLPAGYWYYCAEAQAYYPYVKECRGAWQPVAPQAPLGR